MRLYFFRHAEAGYHYPSDFDRELTERGRRRTQTAAEVMVRLGIKPEHIYSSPRIRALQTAEIAAAELGMEVEVDRGIDFGFDLHIVEMLIEPLNEGDEVMFVGHNPSFEAVVSDLTGGDVAMKKGGLARVDVVGYASPIEGQLIWLIAPKVFDALGA